MFRKMLLAYKWRKLRLLVWERRLLQRLDDLSPRISPAVQSSLHVAWGPFYGGSVILDRTYSKAKIYVQIPFDRYVTDDERHVMALYSISPRDLPYFIFFHECYHLIDGLAHLDRREGKGLDTYQANLKRAARQSSDYRNLPIEASADDFAYRQFVELNRKATKAG
ncbi:hypothetical protein [Paenibacillus sp. HJGM_3]|uniref:hypothetical protein n=1 Tax=Paenibacillus sp. HJGM_3 TaxID=3379816 RepID=UPI00385FEB10